MKRHIEEVKDTSSSATAEKGSKTTNKSKYQKILSKPDGKLCVKVTSNFLSSCEGVECKSEKSYTDTHFNSFSNFP